VIDALSVRVSVPENHINSGLNHLLVIVSPVSTYTIIESPKLIIITSEAP